MLKPSLRVGLPSSSPRAVSYLHRPPCPANAPLPRGRAFLSHKEKPGCLRSPAFCFQVPSGHALTRPDDFHHPIQVEYRLMTLASIANYSYARQSLYQHKHSGGVGRCQKSFWKHEEIKKYLGRLLPVLSKRSRGLRGLIIDMHAGDGEATPHQQPDMFAGGALITTPHLAITMAEKWHAERATLKRPRHLSATLGRISSLMAYFSMTYTNQSRAHDAALAINHCC